MGGRVGIVLILVYRVLCIEVNLYASSLNLFFCSYRVRYLLSPFFYSRVIMALFIIWSIVGVALVCWNNRADECVGITEGKDWEGSCSTFWEWW